MAARVKLTAAEGAALVGIAVEKLGAAAVVPVLASALPADKVARLLRRESTPLTVAEKKAIVEAVIPLLPGKTPRQKINAVVKAIRPAFATRARYDEVMAYVNERVKAHLAAPAAGAVPAWDACTHASCWNGKNAAQRMMNVLSPAFTDAKFSEYRDWMLSVGCNTAHVFLSNKADGEGGGYCIYGTGWTWEINEAFCATFRARIADLRAHGLAVVVWLFADDSSAWNKEAKKNFPKYCADLKAQGLLDAASIVVAGLELDEYYGSSDVSALVNAIRKVWPGKVGTHQTSGRYEFATLADIVFYQVDPGNTAAQIKAKAQAVVKAAGKPLCFFELDRQPNRSLCDAAIAGGAFAVGNWKGESATAQPAAPAGWPAELADVQWLHANVRDWPATAKMTASISGGQIRFPYDKANAWPVATSGVEKGTNANVWAIVQVGGKWFAGTWEWLRKGQTSKPVGCLDGSKGDHFKVSPLNNWRPRSGERFYIMVSGHARAAGRNVQERSNPSPVVWP